MIETFLKSSIYTIKPDEYIEVNEGRFDPILSVKVENDEAHLTLQDNLLLKLTNEDLGLYRFSRVKPYRDEVEVKLTYSCKHCNRPVAYDSLEGIEAHLDRCLYNEKNSMCAMCKYLTIYEEAPYPRNHKMYQSPDAEWAFGNYRKPYCEKYDKYLEEVDIINRHTECFDIFTEMPKIKYTKDYEEWVRLSTEHEESLEKNHQDGVEDIEVVEEE